MAQELENSQKTNQALDAYQQVVRYDPKPPEAGKAAQRIAKGEREATQRSTARMRNTYRPDRSALDAVRQVHGLLDSGHTDVVDADLSGYSGSIPQDELMKSVARRVSDRHLLSLIKMWLEAPVEEVDDRGRHHRTTRNRDEGRGTPQGSPLSPLLANTMRVMRSMMTRLRSTVNEAKTRTCRVPQESVNFLGYTIG